MASCHTRLCSRILESKVGKKKVLGERVNGELKTNRPPSDVCQ